jgi:hypothetical protein
MLSYFLHLLQPLDVVCFLVLKHAYNCKIETLICYYINYITKLEFLLVFKVVFEQLFTTANICSAFHGASLVSLQPETVLLQLDVQLHMPLPAALPEALWKAKTPSSVHELDAQSMLICECIQ